MPLLNYRLEMGAEVESGANLLEMPGSPPPFTATSGSDRASALSDGEPLPPRVTLEVLSFLESWPTFNLRPSPRSLSNCSVQRGWRSQQDIIHQPIGGSYSQVRVITVGNRWGRVWQHAVKLVKRSSKA